MFECVKCGFTDNADFQATLNLLQWGQTLMEAKTDRQVISFPRISLPLGVGVVKVTLVFVGVLYVKRKGDEKDKSV